METPKPDSFNVAGSRSGISYVTMMSVHLRKVFGHELDSTFVKSECTSEMAHIYYRCGGLHMDISLDETQRQYRVSGQINLGCCEWHDERHFNTPDANEIDPYTWSIKVLLECYRLLSRPRIVEINVKVMAIGTVPIHS